MTHVWHFRNAFGETVTCSLWRDFVGASPDRDSRLVSPHALELFILEHLAGVARDVARRDLLSIYEALSPTETWQWGHTELQTSTLVQALVAACQDGRLVARSTPPRRWTVSFVPELPSAPTREEPSEKSWIEILVQSEDGEPFPHQRLRLVLPDGSNRDLRTDDRGRLRMDDVPTGSCSVQVILT